MNNDLSFKVVINYRLSGAYIVVSETWKNMQTLSESKKRINLTTKRSTSIMLVMLVPTRSQKFSFFNESNHPAQFTLGFLNIFLIGPNIWRTYKDCEYFLIIFIKFGMRDFTKVVCQYAFKWFNHSNCHLKIFLSNLRIWMEITLTWGIFSRSQQHTL